MEFELFEYISQSTLRMMAPLLISDDTLICNINPTMKTRQNLAVEDLQKQGKKALVWSHLGLNSQAKTNTN